MLVLKKDFKFQILIIAWCLLSHLPVRSQNINGHYKNGKEEITINQEQIEYYLIEWGCCIHSPYKGSGTFKISNKRLFIVPKNIKPPLKSTIEKKDPLDPDTMIVRVINCPYSVVILSRKFKKDHPIVSDKNGLVKIPRSEVRDYDSIQVGSIGAKQVGTKSTKLSNYDFDINLAFNEDDDLHYDFITNNEKGIAIKVCSDKIYLKYNKRTKRHYRKLKFTWHRFDKVK